MITITSTKLGVFLSVVVALAVAVAEPVSHDVVVYGGTSGGVVAAVQAARSGKSVVLISPTIHLGGMTSSGLGWTDLGKSSILGGISREFYHRIYQSYQKDEAWNWQSRSSYGNSGQGGPAFNKETETASVFEPKIAEAIFDELVAEQGFTVVQGRLDLESGVIMNGEKILSLKLEDGREFAGSMFIDASYEGDLLPGAGVSFTMGREANVQYGESISGIQAGRAVKNQLPDGIDPYVIAGDPASGLLPGVKPDAGGAEGTADDRFQAYCYRMVLTDIAANRVMIEQPADYDEAAYELLFRAIEAGQTSGFFKLDLMPNRKTDSNNTGGISTDFIGGNYGANWNWATLGHAERMVVAKQHENWQRGLVWTLQNHTRVPKSVRDRYAAWGLPADEFQDNGNWPWQLYIREARRMVSGYVMTQDNCNGSRVAKDSIGLAAYSMDSHHVQRHVKDGMVKNEGDVQVRIGEAYPVSYRSIVPKQGECSNLLVPWSLSASHMAFGSIRMEPVFMALSQSAAIAAGLAIDQDLAVQDVDYAELRPLLLAAGQALGDPVIKAPTVVVDNSDSSLVEIDGDWLESSATVGYIGGNYLHDDNVGAAGQQVVYHIPSDLSGMHRVFLRWTAHENRASNVEVEIRHQEGVSKATVDQRKNGAKWNLIGFYSFSGSPEEGIIIKAQGANGYVIADAVGFSKVEENDDTDGDGLSDLDELDLGLDPTVSDVAFIQAVKNHPEFFSLHREDEIYELRISRTRLEPDLSLEFDLEGAEGGEWSLLEGLQVPVSSDGHRSFYRISLQTDASNLVKKLAQGESQKIVVYGTSLTAGGAWVGEMKSWLNDRYEGEVTIVNSGLSGKNSAEGLAQLENKVLTQDPDVIFIEFGINDAFRYSDGTPSLSVSEARENLVAMLEAIESHHPGTEVILQTMNPVWDSPKGSNASATLRPDLEQYYRMYREVAAQRDLLLIDYYINWKHLQDEDPAVFQAYLADGVHPNIDGIRDVMMPVLKWKLGAGKSATN